MKCDPSLPCDYQPAIKLLSSRIFFSPWKAITESLLEAFITP